jgi:SAM-dependent methyltransferase
LFGTLLTCFRNLDCRVCGVDPAENLRAFTQEKDIPVLVDYWGKGIVDKVLNFLDSTFKVPADKEKQIKADIITATNVFAHVDDAEGFLQACQKVLSPNGLVVIEFPYCDEMIEHVEFDTVYHEHLSYFTFNSFATLASRMKFVIVKTTQTNIHGGSIRFFLKPAAYFKGKVDSSFEDFLVQQEKDKGLYNLATYDDFSEKVAKNKIDLNYLVDSLEKEMKVIGFAASAKGNTMLNHFNISFDYIVDENPLKFGYYTPGMNIPIYPTEVLKQEKENLAIVILAWNFYDEIKEKIKKIRPNRRDILIRYVPSVKEEETVVMRWD